MSTTAPATLMPGFAYPTAVALAGQIDGTADAAALVQNGVSYPLATELAAQMTAGTGHVGKLVALGIPPDLAVIIVAAIDAE